LIKGPEPFALDVPEHSSNQPVPNLKPPEEKFSVNMHIEIYRSSQNVNYIFVCSVTTQYRILYKCILREKMCY